MAKVFFSYAHEDEELRDKLETHLALLKRQGVIATWHDRRIGPGDAFADEIDAALETSDIVLLLVSADFLASDYCHDIEMRRALERHEQGLAHVIPVILRPCDWHSSEFGHLNAVPRDGKPITKHATLDEGFVQVAEAIRSAAQEASGPAAPAPSQPLRDQRPAPDRSSNLRIPRTFSDRDRDHFFDEGLQYCRRSSRARSASCSRATTGSKPVSGASTPTASRPSSTSTARNRPAAASGEPRSIGPGPDCAIPTAALGTATASTNPSPSRTTATRSSGSPWAWHS